jgi:hypothetical protein
MANLLDEMKAETTINRRQTKVEEIQRILSKEEYVQFMEAMKDDSISNAAIIRVLKKRGVEASVGFVSTLRRKINGI